MSDIQFVEAPPGVEGAGFFATSLDKAIGFSTFLFIMAASFCNFLLWY